MTYDLNKWGDKQFIDFTHDELQVLQEIQSRVPMVHYTLRGYVAEHYVMEYLHKMDNCIYAEKIPDTVNGHFGDIRFWVNTGQEYTIEVKAPGKLYQPNKRMKSEFLSLSNKPTRKKKGWPINGYAFGDFNFLAVDRSVLTHQDTLIFCRLQDLPKHKSDARLARTSMNLTSKIVSPWTTNLEELLNG